MTFCPFQTLINLFPMAVFLFSSFLVQNTFNVVVVERFNESYVAFNFVHFSFYFVGILFRFFFLLFFHVLFCCSNHFEFTIHIYYINNCMKQIHAYQMYAEYDLKIYGAWTRLRI